MPASKNFFDNRAYTFAGLFRFTNNPMWLAKLHREPKYQPPLNRPNELANKQLQRTVNLFIFHELLSSPSTVTPESKACGS